MGAPRTTMTPEREAEARRLAAEGVCTKHAAQRMGIPVSTLQRWHRLNGEPFPNGNSAEHLRGQPYTEAMREAGRRNIKLAMAARWPGRGKPVPPRPRAPKLSDILTPEQLDAYRLARHKRLTMPEAMRVAGRADLIAQVAS